MSNSIPEPVYFLPAEYIGEADHTNGIINVGGVGSTQAVVDPPEASTCGVCLAIYQWQRSSLLGMTATPKKN